MFACVCVPVVRAFGCLHTAHGGTVGGGWPLASTGTRWWKSPAASCTGWKKLLTHTQELTQCQQTLAMNRMFFFQDCSTSSELSCSPYYTKFKVQFFKLCGFSFSISFVNDKDLLREFLQKSIRQSAKMFPQSHIASRLCAPGLNVCLSTGAAVLLWGKIITHSYRMQTVKYCLDCWFPPTSRHESTNTYCRMLIWCVRTVQINASVVRRNVQWQHLGSTYKPVATQNGPLSKPQKDQEQRDRKRWKNATTLKILRSWEYLKNGGGFSTNTASVFHSQNLKYQFDS